MNKCLVLGGNGFIGSHVVDSLASKGNSVRVFDRFGGGKVLYEDSPKIEPFSGNFMNMSDLDSALEGIDYVFHFISTTTPVSAENDPIIDIDTNIKRSVELLQTCVKNGVKRVIFASTGGAIYGEGGEPHKETDTPSPVSPYAIGKLTIEHYLRYFRTKHDLDSVVLRISNPYGERQPFHRKQGVIPIFLENIYSDQPITVLGDGSMVRDYIYVKDVAEAVSTIFDKDIQHDTYNIGSGEGVSLSELVEVISETTSKEFAIEHRDVPATFLDRVVLDTSRYANEFGKAGKTPLAAGIAATAEYIREGLLDV